MMISMLALAFLQSSAEMRAADGLNPFALGFMLISMGAVTLLAGWCFFRVLQGKRHFDPDGTGPARSPVPGEAEHSPRSRDA